MSKYYISNGDEFIKLENDSVCFIKGSVAGANRFKYTDAANILEKYFGNNPEYSCQKLFNSKSGKRYVVTNATQFAGKNGRMTGKFEEAKPFRSAADAERYIKAHSDLKNKMVNPVIWDEDFHTIDMSAHREFTKEELKFFNKDDLMLSRRMSFNSTTKKILYDKSNGVCVLCGSPIKYEDATIDHIVPRSRGGTNDLSNLRCLCERCNRLKDNSLDSELKQSITNILAEELYRNPMTELSNQLIRCIVRGTIKNYQPM